MRDEAQAVGSKVVIEWGFRVDLLGWVHQLRAPGFMHGGSMVMRRRPARHL